MELKSEQYNKKYKTTLTRYLRGVIDKSVKDHEVAKLSEELNMNDCKLEVVKDIETIRKAYSSPYIQSCMSYNRLTRDPIRKLLMEKYNIWPCDFYHYIPSAHLAILKYKEKIVARGIVELYNGRCCLIRSFGSAIYKHTLERQLAKKYPTYTKYRGYGHKVFSNPNQFHVPATKINEVIRGYYNKRWIGKVLLTPYFDFYSNFSCCLEGKKWVIDVERGHEKYARDAQFVGPALFVGKSSIV